MVKNGEFYVNITTLKKAQGREGGLGKCLVKLIILGKISMSFIKETRPGLHEPDVSPGISEPPNWQPR